MVQSAGETEQGAPGSTGGVGGNSSPGYIGMPMTDIITTGTGDPVATSLSPAHIDALRPGAVMLRTYLSPVNRKVEDIATRNKYMYCLCTYHLSASCRCGRATRRWPRVSNLSVEERAARTIERDSAACRRCTPCRANVTSIQLTSNTGYAIRKVWIAATHIASQWTHHQQPRFSENRCLSHPEPDEASPFIDPPQHEARQAPHTAPSTEYCPARGL